LVSQVQSLPPYPLGLTGAISLKRTLAIFNDTFRTFFPDFPAQLIPVSILNALITRMPLTIIVTNYFKQLIKQHRPVFPKLFHVELAAKFLVGMIKLNLLLIGRRPFFCWN
jgi:hypothetical protein